MIDERFSAYLDGETSPAETEAVWSELNRDPALRALWSRQHWLRSALRETDVSVAYDPHFAARVGRALDDGAPGDNVRPMPAVPRRRWRTAVSLAAAASIVAAVLLIAEPLGGGADGTAPVVAEAEDAPTAVAAEPAADARPVTVAAESGRAADHWSVSDPDVEDQLNGYLLEHNGLARSYGMSGATPSFLRVATYGQSANR